MADDPTTPEESMVNPTQNAEESSALTVSPRNTTDELEKLLYQVINLSPDKVFHEPTCAICFSPNRSDIEQNWIQNKSIAEAQKIFKDKTGKQLSSEVIENHMTQHMAKGVRAIQQIEYIDRIKRLHSQNASTLDRISMCYAMLIERMMGVNSITPNGEESVAEIEKVKSAETARLMGIFNNFLKLQASILGEMKLSGELITIPSSQFVNVFNDALLEARTDREKQLIKDILDKLANINKKSQ